VIRTVASLVAVAALVAAAPARGLVWPDVQERVERDLTASDVATRRAAARDLATLSRGRGGPLAVAALQDPDDEVRLAAADAAIRLRATGATEVAIGWLNARDARVRRKACEIARALPSPLAVAPLARSLGDPDSEVRSAAAEALGRQSSAEAVPPLLGRLDDAAPLVRVRIVEALAQLGDARAVVPLVGKVQDSSPEVRAAVARTLGDLGDPRASPALVLALRDPSQDVRREAVVSIGRLRSTDAVDALAPLLTERVPALRVAAFDALGRIATPEALHVLVGALGTGEDASGALERTPVRAALAAAGDAAVPLLHGVVCVAAPSAAASSSAAWVLGALHARGEQACVVEAMRRGTLPTAAAMHALAGMGAVEAEPVVLEFIADPSSVVRSEALAAAFALLDPARPDGRAVEPLAAALRDPRLSATERQQVVALLGKTGAARAAPLLVELASSRDVPLRIAAIDALGSLGPTGTSDKALLAALEARDARVRLHAAVALGEAGSGTARDGLLAMLESGDEVDRSAVLTALSGVLSRSASDAAIAKLSSALALAAGAERDAVLQALLLPRMGTAVDALVAAGRSRTVEDRRAAAVLCAAHAGDARSVALARGLLEDPDAATRAQAAWSLGSIGDVTDVERLEGLARGGDSDSAANAIAAMGRIVARVAAKRAAGIFCPLVGDRRPAARANALAALALAGTRCKGGAAERTALLEDASEDVRIAASLAVRQGTTDEDRRALERCAKNDPSGRVADRCHTQAPGPAGQATRTLVYVVPQGADVPRAGAAYALSLPDGMLRLGVTDRRGAVFDPTVPEGEMRLSSGR
jgi:HEAT repeat protein